MARKRVVRQFAASIAFPALSSNFYVPGTGSAIGAQSFTVEGWFKLADTPEISNAITHNIVRATGAFMISQYAGTLYVHRDDGAIILSDLTFWLRGNTGRWLHYALSCDATTSLWSLYIDGVLVASATRTGGWNIANSGNTFEYGVGTYNGVIGSHARPRIYIGKALSATEVAARYYDDSPAFDSFLTLDLPLTDIGLTTLANAVAGKPTGTLSSASLWSSDVPMVPRRYRQNRYTYSNTLSNAAHSLFGLSTPTNNGDTPPNGATAAWRLPETATTGVHLIRETLGASVLIPAGVLTRAFAILKAGVGTDWVAVSGLGGGGSPVYFRLSTGTFGTINGNALAYGAIPLGNGWYYIYCEYLSDGANLHTSIYMASADATNSYTGTVGNYMLCAGYGVQTADAAIDTTLVETGASPVLYGPSAEPAKQNLVVAANDVANAVWSNGTGITATAQSADVSNPLGGATDVNKVVYDGSGVADASRLFQAVTLPGGGSTITAWLRVASGTATVRLGTNAEFGTVCALDTTWRRFTFSPTVNGSSVRIYGASGSNATFTVYAWCPSATLTANDTGQDIMTSTTAINTGTPRVMANDAENLVPNTDMTSAGYIPSAGGSCNPIDSEGWYEVVDASAGAIQAWQTPTCSLVAGRTYTVSVKIKKTSGGSVIAISHPYTSVGYSGRINPDTGAVNDVGGASAAKLAHGAIDRGDHWLWFSTFVCEVASGRIVFYPAIAAPGAALTGGPDTATQTGSNRFKHPQIAKGNGVSTFVATTGTAIEGATSPRPRVARQNLVTYSGDLSNAAWIRTGAPVPSTTEIAPDGSATASLFSDDTSAGFHRTYQTVPGQQVGQTMCQSVYVKAGTLANVGLSNNGTANSARFDLSTGTVTGMTGTGTTSGIRAIGGGWYRIWMAAPSTAATDFFTLNVGSSDSSIYAGYTGTGTGTVYLWHPQATNGLGEAEYVATTTVAINDGAAPKVLAI